MNTISSPLKCLLIFERSCEAQWPEHTASVTFIQCNYAQAQCYFTWRSKHMILQLNSRLLTGRITLCFLILPNTFSLLLSLKPGTDLEGAPLARVPLIFAEIRRLTVWVCGRLLTPRCRRFSFQKVFAGPHWKFPENNCISNYFKYLSLQVVEVLSRQKRRVSHRRLQ